MATKVWRGALLLMAAGWLMGMGGGNGSTSEKQVPIPEQNYTAVVTDSRTTKAEVKRFAWEGKLYFQGQYGSATVTLPFGKVQSVQVKADAATRNPTQILAHMTLRGGETLDLAMDRTSKCYGETSFGTYEIFLRDISSIQFQ